MALLDGAPSTGWLNYFFTCDNYLISLFYTSTQFIFFCKKIISKNNELHKDVICEAMSKWLSKTIGPIFSRNVFINRLAVRYAFETVSSSLLTTPSKQKISSDYKSYKHLIKVWFYWKRHAIKVFVLNND